MSQIRFGLHFATVVSQNRRLTRSRQCPALVSETSRTTIPAGTEGPGRNHIVSAFRSLTISAHWELGLRRQALFTHSIPKPIRDESPIETIPGHRCPILHGFILRVRGEAEMTHSSEVLVSQAGRICGSTHGTPFAPLYWLLAVSSVMKTLRCSLSSFFLAAECRRLGHRWFLAGREGVLGGRNSKLIGPPE